MATETKKNAAGAAKEIEAVTADNSVEATVDNREGMRMVDPAKVIEEMKKQLKAASEAIEKRDRVIAVQKGAIERLNAALIGMCGVYSYDGR